MLRAEGVNPQTIPLNPHPGQPVEIIGSVPVSYSVDRLRVIYSTDSAWQFCKGLNFPDGGPFPLESTIEVATRKVGDQVVAEIQPDRFAPSVCHWKLSDVRAVIRDKNGEEDQALIAIGYDWYSSHHLLGGAKKNIDVSEFYCGFEHTAFMCGGAGVGDTGYLPVEIKAETHQASFVIHDSGSDPPKDHVPPTRDENGVPTFRASPRSFPQTKPP